MFYYSQAISEFTTKLHRLANHILTFEMKVKALRTRFEFQGYRYPLTFVTFEKPKTLGFFDSHYLQIGIHRHFLFANDEELLKNVLRHELLHYLNYIIHGDTVEAHGKEYRDLAKSFFYAQEVYSSTYDNYEGKIILEEQSQEFKILEKIKKLLSLSENNSSLQEAQLALAKANQLLKSHNLSLPCEENYSEDQNYLIKILYTAKRVGAKQQAISQILSHFFVKPIFNHSQISGHRLEIFGLKQDVELACYIFDYLNHEMERLWLNAKASHQLKGLKAKNSFFWGLGEGFISTINKNQPSYTNKESKALILKDQVLQHSFQSFYKSKRSSHSKAQADFKSKKLGREIGKKMRISQGISQKIKGLLS